VRATAGAGAARWWYRRQVLASLPGAIRLRTRGATTDSVHDLRYGARLLVRRPAFAATAIATLAVGIGATSAALTLANAVLLRPLPYVDAGRLVAVMEVDRERADSSGNLSWPDFEDYARSSRTLSGLAVYSGGSRTVTIPGLPAERVPAVMVSGTFFDVLGTTPLLGRAVNDADTHNGAAPVVMLTHGAWQRRFGGDPSIVGRTIALNGQSTTVIGVLPAAFEFPLRGTGELWLPVQPTPDQRGRKFYHWLDAVGRLAPGVTAPQAQAELDGIARSFAPMDPRAHQHAGVELPLLRERMVAPVRPVLALLIAAALLVLVVAAANLAGLMFAHHAARSDEIGVRAALGAGRWRLVRQLVAESASLATAGGLAGVVLGQALLKGLIAAIPPRQRLSLPHVNSLSLDASALLIAAAVTVAATVLFGVLPASRTARAERLRASRGVAGASIGDIRWQSIFLAVQVSIAVMLLSGAGLLGRSVARLLDVNPGFRTDHLLTSTVSLPDARYTTIDARLGVQRELLDRVKAMPGVLGVSTINQLPLAGGGNSGTVARRGDPPDAAITTLVRSAGTDYFGVMEIPLIEGRLFAESDKPGMPDVVVVNERLARQLAPDGSAVGLEVGFPFMPGQYLRIVGVVGNEQYDSLEAPMKPVLYFAQSQAAYSGFSLVARTSGDPGAMSNAVASEIARLDPAITVYQRTTMDGVMQASNAVFQRRSVLILMGGLAGVALLLAAVGIYGVLSQRVASQQRELGVRIALGASGSAIVRGVMRRGLTPVAIGLVAGLAASAAAGRALGSLLYGTRAWDPATLLAVSATLALVAVAACALPTRRAVRVDPVSVLRDR
jgi:predicted permease